MNRKFTFYCICLKDREFERLRFEMITDDLFCKSVYDLNIGKICDLYELDMVFDWQIISVEDVEEETRLRMLDGESGRLLFQNEEIEIEKKQLALLNENLHLYNKLNHNYKKLSHAYEKLIEYEKAKKKRKEYPSVWIDPFGVEYRVGFADHNKFAAHWLRDNDPEAYEEALNSFSYYYEFLEKKGWIRILGWRDPPCFVLPDVINPKMANALREYCLSNEVPYQAFPEILKS